MRGILLCNPGFLLGDMTQISLEKIEQAKGSIPNLHVVSLLLVRGGQPEPEGFRHLKAAGVKTVLSLRTSGGGLRSFFRRPLDSNQSEDPEIAQERILVGELGMKFIQMPLDVAGTPSAEAIERFLEIVSSPEHPPMFVHCLHGRDRTGLLMAAYRVAIEGWDSQRAYAEMLACGFDAGRTNLSDVFFDFARRLESAR